MKTEFDWLMEYEENTEAYLNDIKEMIKSGVSKDNLEEFLKKIHRENLRDEVFKMYDEMNKNTD